MAYTERTDHEIIAALEEWVKEHPRSNEPTGFVGGRPYSPKEVLEAIKAGDSYWSLLPQFLREQGKNFDRDPLEFIEQTIKNNKKLKRRK